VGFILSYFDGTHTEVVGWSGGGALILLVFLNALTTQLIYLKSFELGMQIRVSLTALIYAKVIFINFLLYAI